MQEEILQQFNDALQAEANEKIKKAIQLFLRVDQTFRWLTLRMTGFSGELTGKSLREHFDTLDLMDGLDEVIENLRYEAEENNPSANSQLRS